MSKMFYLMVNVDGDGKLHFESKNDGFDALQLMGILDWKMNDIRKQIAGEIKPDTIQRTYIKDTE